jgi:carboxymethylenebutenolidase
MRWLSTGAAVCLVSPCLALGTASAAPDTLNVSLAEQGSPTRAFVVVPAGKAICPGVVLVHEWWGLNGQIRGMARRLADLGYVVIVPDLYRGRVTGDPEMAHELSRGLTDASAAADIDASAAWLRSHPRVGKRPIGVMGFCMGGRLALLAPLRSNQFAASVVFYGPPETDPGKLATLRAPLLGHFGTEDQGIPAAQVAALRDGLRQAGKSVEIYEYSGAGHAFMNETGRNYHAAAARIAWARTAAFLGKHLKGS